VKGIDKPVKQTTHVEKAQAVGGIIEEQLALTQVGESIYGFTQLLALLHRVQEGSMYRHYGIHLSQSFRCTKIVLFNEKNKFSSRLLPARLQKNRFCKGQVPNVADKTKLTLQSGTKNIEQIEL
jgi:hypothetical protein